ncbi:unnamed protein product [Cylindrotheca closterium]|uniref:Uncharacterized protein n=1 Tax=Cylindrotheca closterium TaxID=2856 RepID=A0AAD2CTE3_9STRA|nr:unnamed protein product [Cylindrotheca closterium]
MDKSSLLTFAAASAAATGVALSLAQTDFVSRKFLDSKQLDAKRRSEYNYRWKAAMEKAYLQINYTLAGGISAVHNSPGLIDKQIEVISDETEMEGLAKRIAAKDSQFRCLKVDRDAQDTQGEFYLFLIDWETKYLYQLPLMAFGTVLAGVFEDQLTSNTLCFVADASSGKGTALLKELVLESKSGVAVVSEPLWMVQLARLVQANLYPAEKIQKLFFGLCRMEAWFVRDECKESKTVMFTLPGQACTSTLLPLAQKTFPEDRHVFVYDGCQASIEYANNCIRKKSRGKVASSLESVLYGASQDPIIHSVPLPSNSPLCKSVLKLVNKLSDLPVEQAQVVECWMGSIDAFFKLKEEEKKNGYLPYVFKLQYLTDGAGKYEDKSASYWTMCSILQFIAGSRSRQLSEGLIDAAREFMKDYNERIKGEGKGYVLSKNDVKIMEECVFLHKKILLGNKTLQDTVQPKQHWTLKEASKKGGCACCGPEDDDEEEEEQGRGRPVGSRIDMSMPGAFAMPGALGMPSGTKRKSNSPTGRKNSDSKRGYVDGRAGFAFDPSRFQ